MSDKPSSEDRTESSSAEKTLNNQSPSSEKSFKDYFGHSDLLSCSRCGENHIETVPVKCVRKAFKEREQRVRVWLTQQLSGIEDIIEEKKEACGHEITATNDAHGHTVCLECFDLNAWEECLDTIGRRLLGSDTND